VGQDRHLVEQLPVLRRVSMSKTTRAVLCTNDVNSVALCLWDYQSACEAAAERVCGVAPAT
jgi:hypothetical protein